MAELATTAEVIESIGGVPAVARLTSRNHDAAERWKYQKHFPPDTYLVMQAELKARGLTAPPSLWRMVS